MEDIRGVTINSLIIKQLEDRGWVEVIGHRETVGRPALFATTRQFLDDLGLASLDQLPPLEGGDIQESALDRLDFESLSAQMPLEEAAAEEAVPVPSEPGASALAVMAVDLEPNEGSELPAALPNDLSVPDAAPEEKHETGPNPESQA